MSYDADVFGPPPAASFDPDVFGPAKPKAAANEGGAGGGRGFVNPPNASGPRHVQVPPTGAVAANAANKGIAAPFDALLNAPTNVINLGKAAFGTGATALGRPDLAPELTPTPDYARGLMERFGLVQDKNEPQTPGQRILDSTVQGGVGMALNPSGSVGHTVGAALVGALSGGASGATKEATGSDAAALTAAILAPAGATAAAAGARGKIEALRSAQLRNAPRDQALRAGIESGYKVPPATAMPTVANKIVESVSGKAATQQAASLNNAEVTNALAREALKLPPDTALTPEVTRAVRDQAFKAGYEPISTAGPVRTGAAYRRGLDGIVANYQGAARSFPEAVRDDVSKMVDALRVRSFDAGDAIKMSATLREDASKSFANGDAALGKAQRAAAKVIEDQIERGLATAPPDLLANFRAARQLMAQSHTVEESIRVGTGNVEGPKLAAALQKGEPLTGPLRVAAEFSQNYPKAVQPPRQVGSAGVSALEPMASAGFGIGGASAFGPMGAAAAAIPLLRPVARAALLSGPYQRSLIPDYTPSRTAKLLSAVPDLSTGAALAPYQFAEELRRQKDRQ